MKVDAEMEGCGSAAADNSIDPAADLAVPTTVVPTGTARDDSIIRLERHAGRHFDPVHERRSQHRADLAAKNFVGFNEAPARFVGAQFGHWGVRG